MRITRQKHNRRGQLLVEAMVALSVGVTGILGIVGILSQSLSLSRTVSDNYQASLLAAEGVELVKNILDTSQENGSWSQWLPNGTAGWYTVDYATQSLSGALFSGTGFLPTEQQNGTFCANSNQSLYFDGATQTYNNRQQGSPTKFGRCVYIAPVGNDEFQVDSVVSWTTRGGGAFSVDTEDFFYNWRK